MLHLQYQNYRCVKMANYIEELYGPLDEFEQQQQRTGRFIKEFQEENASDQQHNFQLNDQLFADHSSIVIRKHRRFAPYPRHSHQFMELNYMYQGSSQQIVNGESLLLREKEVLLLDSNSEHELAPLGENDLLINFLFRTQDLNLGVLKNIDSRSAGLTYDFIMNAIVGHDSEERHLVLDISQNPEIQTTFEEMIREYQAKRHLTNEVLHAYSQILFLQLSRVYHAQLTQIYPDSGRYGSMIKILQRIENDYRQLTLEELAHDLGYNRNYLSNLIKQKSGKTFKELITEQRLRTAHDLVLSTDLPIETISAYVGFSNKTYFYKKYRAFYHETPSNIRKLR